MTTMRRFTPKQSQFVTRRVRDRCLMLTPTQQVNQTVLYALGVAQLKASNVRLHGLMVESNHHHCAVTDAAGESELSTFFREFHSTTARALNAHYGRGENFWSQPGSFSKVEVHGGYDLEKQLVYLWTNPVKDGLVDRPEDWPGVKFLPKDLGTTITVKKPSAAFFGNRWPKAWVPTHPEERRRFLEQRRLLRRERKRQERLAKGHPRGKKKKERAPRPPRFRDTLPDEVTITISRPPGYEHLTIEELREHFQELVDDEVLRIHAQRKAEGKTRVMGVKAILNQDPFASIGDVFPTFARNPGIACKDKATRIALLKTLQDWRARYRKALGLWRERVRDVTFPAGTYWMSHFHKAVVEPSYAQP